MSNESFLQWGSMGEIYVFFRVRCPAEILFLTIKFQLEMRSNKKVIAKKCLTNLYELYSTSAVSCRIHWKQIFDYSVVFNFWLRFTFNQKLQKTHHPKIYLLVPVTTRSWTNAKKIE